MSKKFWIVTQEPAVAKKYTEFKDAKLAAQKLADDDKEPYFVLEFRGRATPVRSVNWEEEIDD